MAGCEKCDGNDTCIQAGCNMDCRDWGEWCETIVMGGFNGMAPESITKDQKLSLASFNPCFRIEQCTALMIAAGLRIGDIVTHVNGKFPQDMKEFADMIESLPAGTVFKVWNPNGSRKDVTL